MVLLVIGLTLETVVVALLEHALLVIVHFKVTLLPACKPVTVLFGLFGFVMTAPFAAPTMVQVPISITAGVLAPKVKLPESQFLKLAPAEATVVGASLIKIISSKESAHGALLMVHLNRTDLPANNPVIVVVRLLGLVMIAPLAAPTILHKPEPIVGKLADMVKELLLQLISVSAEPATAGVGGDLIGTVNV